MAEQVYKPSDIEKKTGLSRNRIHQLTKGYTRKIKKVETTVKPVLTANVHFTWIAGKLRYTEEGLAEILKQKRESNTNGQNKTVSKKVGAQKV